MVDANLKTEAKLTLPERVDNNLGYSIKVLSEGVASLLKLPEKVVDTVVISGATLFKPLVAYFNGKATIISARSFVETQNIRKELSQCQLAINVAKNLAIKHQSGQEIPKGIVDTDTLFAIQNAAAETTDKDFLEFWAHLYTEEACKPNTISKKTVELCKVLDKQVAEILEKKIFPYCASGFFFAAREFSVYEVSKAEDYGFLTQKDILLNPKAPNDNVILQFGQYTVVCRIGFSVLPSHPNFSLSMSGEEIRNIIINKGMNIDFDILINCLKEASKNWQLSDKFKDHIVKFVPGKQIDTNFIVVQNDKIIYPESWQNKSVRDYNNACLETLDIKLIPA